MDSKTIPFTLNVNISAMQKKLEDAITEATNAVHVGLASIEALKIDPEVVHGENVFMMYSPLIEHRALDENKKMFSSWVTKKGFEQLTNGLKMMLEDACSMLANRDELELKRPKTWQEINAILSTPAKKIYGTGLPQLLKFVENNVVSDLKYLEEVTSINQLRNCLVHRNGIVGDIDAKKEGVMRVRWRKPIVSQTINGKKQAIDKPTFIYKNETLDLSFDTHVKSIEKGQAIIFSISEFQEIAVTLMLFSQDLFSKLDFRAKNFDVPKTLSL